MFRRRNKQSLTQVKVKIRLAGVLTTIKSSYSTITSDLIIVIFNKTFHLLQNLCMDNRLEASSIQINEQKTLCDVKSLVIQTLNLDFLCEYIL